jgi:cystathionine beta-lyase
LATDTTRLGQLFGDPDGLLPLWIAEPYIPLARGVVEALQARSVTEWYGYETRPPATVRAFWEWMQSRHGWDGSDLHTLISPSVGTSLGVLLELLTEPGDGVILQPPVFTDFKPLITRANRTVVRNSLVLRDNGYVMDLESLAAAAAEPTTGALILCNPHNPVGRVWTADELGAVAAICAQHQVFVIADEIHADLALPGFAYTPFATVAAGSGVSWAATHGPIKTFGLAGVCDTLLVTDNEPAAASFRARSSQLHLTRNNVFAVAAFEAAYRTGEPWLIDLLELVQHNVELLQNGLPPGIGLIPPQATYLAWVDFRALGLEAPELATWLAASGLALSPGHWFGREGAGFARMSIAVSSTLIEEAIGRLTRAVAARY